MLSAAGLKILPDGGEAPQIFYDPGHFGQNGVYIFLGVLFAEGQPEGPVGHLVGPSDGQQHN